MVCTLSSPLPTRAAPPPQAAPPSDVDAELLLPTWGTSPGGVWQHTLADGWVLRHQGLPPGVYWGSIAADPFDPRRWLLLGSSDGAFQAHDHDGQATMRDGTPMLWYTADAGASWAPITLPFGDSQAQGCWTSALAWSRTTAGHWWLNACSDRVWWGTLGSAASAFRLDNASGDGWSSNGASGLDDELIMVNGGALVWTPWGSAAGQRLPSGGGGNHLGTHTGYAGAVLVPDGSRRLVVVDSGQFGFGRGDIWLSADYHSEGLHYLGNYGARTGHAITRDGTIYLGSNNYGQSILKLTAVFTTPTVLEEGVPLAPGEWYGSVVADTATRERVAARIVGSTDLAVLTRSMQWARLSGPADAEAATLSSAFEVLRIGAAYTTQGTDALQIRITDAAGRPVQALALNADGWPVLNATGGALANPLTVTIQIADTTGLSHVALDMRSALGKARVHLAETPDRYPGGGGCLAPQVERDATNDQALSRYTQTCRFLEAMPVREAQVSWRVWVQPSASDTLIFRADVPPWDATPEALATVVVPQAQPHPVIFLPGAPGSYLDDLALNGLGRTGLNLWPGIAGDEETETVRLSRYPDMLQQFSPAPQIVAPDVIRELPIVGDIYGSFLVHLRALGYTEYQVGGDPRNRTAACAPSGQPLKPTLFVFAYDWRLDVAVNAQKLNEYMDCIHTFYPGTQVDIVAHSMGGLVARRFILEHPGTVNKLITMGTPWLGAPKAINALFTGEFLDNATHFLTVSQAQLRALMGSFPGAMQLLPSATYYQLLDPGDFLRSPPLVEEGWDINGNGRANERFDSHANLVTVLDQRFGISPNGQKWFNVGSAGRDFHNVPGQDDWSNDTSGVKYYHIVGNTADARTIMQVKTLARVNCRPNDPVAPRVTTVCFNNREGTLLNFGPGDGTVPLISARRNASLNAPNHTPYPIRNNGGDKALHAALPANPEAKTMIAQYLAGIPGNDPLYLLERRPPANPTAGTNQPMAARGSGVALLPAQGDAQAALGLQPAYYLDLEGINPDTVAAQDGLGTSTAIINNTFRRAVPGVSHVLRGDMMSTVILDSTTSYTVTFQTAAEPLYLAWELGTGDQRSQVVIYRDLNLPAGRTAQLVFGPQHVSELRYDGDGDGSFETSVPTTVNLVGVPAQDRDGPVISAGLLARSPDQLEVTLTAQDASGVAALFYSLDGVTFQPSNGPLVVDPGQVRALVAFADDTAGNRSALFRQELPERSALTRAVRPVMECVADNGNGSYTAWFGYRNDNPVAVSIPVGAQNRFTPGPQNRGQATVFQPGRHVRAFAVPFSSGNQVWSLRGPDGSNRTATASVHSVRCPTP